jgi:hypothetical protein
MGHNIMIEGPYWHILKKKKKKLKVTLENFLGTKSIV